MQGRPRYLQGKLEMAKFLEVKKLKLVEPHWMGKYLVLLIFVIRPLASTNMPKMWFLRRRSCSGGLIKRATLSTYNDSLKASQLLANLPNSPRSYVF
jgi:hypothetical protein